VLTVFVLMYISVLPPVSKSIVYLQLGGKCHFKKLIVPI